MRNHKMVKYQEKEERVMFNLSGVIENAPYVLMEKYHQVIAGSCTGSSNSSCSSSNSSSHSASRGVVGLEGRV